VRTSAAEKPRKEIPYSTLKRPEQALGEYGEPKNNFFQLPVCFPEAMARGVFYGGAEPQMVLLVMMEEWGGFGGKLRKGAAISHTEFVERLKCDAKSVSNASTRLVKVGIFEIVKRAGSVNCYHVNLTRMAACGPHTEETPKPKLELVPKPEASAHSYTPRIIPAGKTIKLPMMWPIAGTDDWEERIVKVHNTAPVPLAVAATRTDTEPELQISEHRAADLSLVEEKAKRNRNPLRSENAKSFPANTSDFRTAVKTLLDREWPTEPLTPAFLVRILTAAGPELPAELFLSHANHDLGRTKNRRNHVTTHDPEILIAYARQARQKWDQDAVSREADVLRQSSENTEKAAYAPLGRALTERVGDSLAEYRQISGNPTADFEQWEAAADLVKREFARKGHSGASHA
jgi:hypothetical protein